MGRRLEFARFPQFQDPLQRERIPDPQVAATFESARIDWAALDSDQHWQWLDGYREILQIRAREIVPRIARIAPGARYTVLGPLAVRQGTKPSRTQKPTWRRGTSKPLLA